MENNTILEGTPVVSLEEINRLMDERDAAKKALEERKKTALEAVSTFSFVERLGAAHDVYLGYTSLIRFTPDTTNHEDVEYFDVDYTGDGQLVVRVKYDGSSETWDVCTIDCYGKFETKCSCFNPKLYFDDALWLRRELKYVENYITVSLNRAIYEKYTEVQKETEEYSSSCR